MEKTNNYYEMSDKALLALIGLFVRETRISQLKTQKQVAEAANINRSTLVQLEHGRGGNLLSLIQVLRVLQQLHILGTFEQSQNSVISPLLLAKLEQKKRKRVRNTQEDKSNSSW